MTDAMAFIIYSMVTRKKKRKGIIIGNIIPFHILTESSTLHASFQGNTICHFWVMTTQTKSLYRKSLFLFIPEPKINSTTTLRKKQLYQQWNMLQRPIVRHMISNILSQFAQLIAISLWKRKKYVLKSNSSPIQKKLKAVIA